ncbi:hypothetical protein IH799_04965, partial [candidate division KSB1 bacterium]|nr:hypothetical protein [candidate division KSB1 bacterium]
MKLNIYHLKGKFKGLLFIFAILIIILLLFHSQRIVNQLRAESRNILQFYANLYASAASEETSSNLNFIFEEIILRTNFPIIQTDPESNPIAWKGIEIDATDQSPGAIEKVKSMVDDLSDPHDSGGAGVWTTTSGVVHLVTSTNNVTVGSTNNLGKLAVEGDTDEVQFFVRGNSSQTANLITAETSGSAARLTLDNTGNLAIEGTISDLSGATLVVDDDLQVNGGDLLTNQTTFNLIDTTPT